MKTFLLSVTLLFSSIVSMGQSAADSEAVKKVVIAFQDDFNEGSFKNAREYAAKDWIHINPLGGIERGMEKVLINVRSVHQTFLKGITMHIETMDIHFPAVDLAIATVIHQMDDYTTPDGIKHVKERQMKSYLVVKKMGSWLLVLDQNTIIRSNP